MTVVALPKVYTLSRTVSGGGKGSEELSCQGTTQKKHSGPRGINEKKSCLPLIGSINSILVIF